MTKVFVNFCCVVLQLSYNVAGAHKRHEAAPRSIQQRMIAWNSDVLTTAARLWPYLAHSYVTTSTGVTIVWVLQLLYMVNDREVKVPV